MEISSKGNKVTQECSSDFTVRVKRLFLSANLKFDVMSIRN